MLQRILILVLAALPSAAGAAGGPPDSSWEVLAEVRANLAAEPQIADFVQTFRPAGFSAGDRESGRLSLSLPLCLRWDYELPFARSYLLCGDVVHTWNSGESSGRRLHVGADEERGLDLLRLSVESIQQRYAAELAVADDGGLRIDLTPGKPTDRISSATLLIDRQRQRLVSLSYRDIEGNITSFELSGYRPLADGHRFSPPEDLKWLED